MAVSEKSWDGSASRFTPEEWKRACLVDTGEGDPETKDRYKLPVMEPDGALSRNGVHAAAARLNQTDITPAQRKSAARKLVRYYGELDEQAPDSIKKMAR